MVDFLVGLVVCWMAVDPGPASLFLPAKDVVIEFCDRKCLVEFVCGLVEFFAGPSTLRRLRSTRRAISRSFSSFSRSVFSSRVPSLRPSPPKRADVGLPLMFVCYATQADKRQKGNKLAGGKIATERFRVCTKIYQVCTRVCKRHVAKPTHLGQAQLQSMSHNSHA